MVVMIMKYYLLDQKGLIKKKNITKIGKMTNGNKINLIDFDDSIKLDGYKHEI